MVSESTVKSGRFEMSASEFYNRRVERVKKTAATDPDKACDLAVQGALKLRAAGWDFAHMRQLESVYDAIVGFCSN